MLLSLNGLPSAGFSEAWKRFWKLPLPPKVLDFLWRLCSNCLPLRVRLHKKGVVLDTCCGLCDMEVEDASHLFFNCSFARSGQLRGWIFRLSWERFFILVFCLCLSCKITWSCEKISRCYGLFGGSAIIGFRVGKLFLRRWR